MLPTSALSFDGTCFGLFGCLRFRLRDFLLKKLSLPRKGKKNGLVELLPQLVFASFGALVGHALPCQERLVKVKSFVEIEKS